MNLFDISQLQENSDRRKNTSPINKHNLFLIGEVFKIRCGEEWNICFTFHLLVDFGLIKTLS